MVAAGRVASATTDYREGGRRSSCWQGRRGAHRLQPPRACRPHRHADLPDGRHRRRQSRQTARCRAAASAWLGGRPLIQLAILHIMSSLTIHCVKEAGEDGHCVGDLVQHLTACTDFTEGEQFRQYYARLATGLMHEYIDEASRALERTRNVAVDALVRMGRATRM